MEFIILITIVIIVRIAEYGAKVKWYDRFKNTRLTTIKLSSS